MFSWLEAISKRIFARKCAWIGNFMATKAKNSLVFGDFLKEVVDYYVQQGDFLNACKLFKCTWSMVFSYSSISRKR